MKEFRLLLTFLLVLLGMQAKAEDKVVIRSATISAGEEFTLPIELVNQQTYKAFQMDIVLPQGITPVLNKKGKIVPVKDEDRFDDTDHSFSYNLVDNTIKLVCTSMSADEISGNSGTLFSINLKTNDDLAGGSYQIKLTNVKFTDVNNQGQMFADATATFTVPGGSTPEPTKYTYQFKADGTILTSGELAAGEVLTAPTAPSKDGYTFQGWNPAFTGTMPEENVVYIAVYTKDPVTPVTGEDKVVIQSAQITAGTEFTLPIELINENTYKAFQMDIVLPQGITPVLNKKGKIDFVKNENRFDDTDHSFSYNLVDNTIKLVCTSMSADVISGNSGTLFSINLKAADDLTSGSYEIKLTDVKFTDEDNQGHTFADATASVTVSASVPTPHSYSFIVDETVVKSGTGMSGSEITAPETPVKTGYTFKGWNPAFTGVMPNQDVTYVAEWTVNKYTMTFVLNNGQNNVVKNQNFGSAIEAPVPTKTGYTFAGWAPVVPATVPAENMTFTAQWTVNSYWLTFVADGVEVSKSQVAYGSSIVVPEAPAKQGYTFQGWNPAVATTMPAADAVYTAVYTKDPIINNDKVSIPSATINSGEEFTLPVELINEFTYKAFQMDIVLPQGITPVLNKKGKVDFIKNENRFEDTDHSFSYNFVNNTIKLVCTSMNAEEISGNNGTLFSIKLKADENLQAGTYTISLTGVKFTTTDNDGFTFADATAIFTVSDAAKIERLQAQLAGQIATADSLLNSKMYGEIRSQLNNTIQNYQNAADVATLERGISLMNTLTEKAIRSIEIYAQLANALEQLNGMLVDNGARDPEILKDAQTYYNNISAQWNAETLTENAINEARNVISNYISLLNKVALIINVEEPGTLMNLINQQVSNYSIVVGLTVTGSVSADELSQITNLYNLVTLNLEETSLTSISSETFYNMANLKTVVLPKNLETIGTYAFRYCYALENITFPASLKTIYNYAFQYCNSLTKVVLPEGMSSLEYRCFSYCNNLQEVVLPSTITIVDRAFVGSNQISKITCKAIVPPTTNGYLMNGNEYLCTLEVPVISVQTYQNTSYWNSFSIVGGSYYGDNMVITSDITFNANDSVLQALQPSISLTKTDRGDWDENYGALYVEGNNTLSLNSFDLYYDAYMAFKAKLWGYDSRFSATLINQAPMRADNVSAKLRLNSYQWFFICLPFDVKVSTITLDREVPFVIYKYDGKRRAEGDMANTWVKMTADSTLHAGIGYIWQAASLYDENYGDRYDITFTLKALNNSNKNNIFRNSDAEVQLNEYLSEFPHNRSWNLIGNPYPAYFNSRAMDITAPFTVWNVNNQNYEAFSPVDDNYIFAPGEAFFIQRPVDQATIPFLAAGRQNNGYRSNEVFFNNARQSEKSAKRCVFNLMLQQDNQTVDRTRIVINPEALQGYESDKDAAKFDAMTKVSLLYTIVDGQRYAINERPIGKGEMILGAEFAMKGIYTITLETTEKEEVYLIDRLTGAEVLMGEEGYTFEAEAGVANDRFLVRIVTDETTGIKNFDSQKSEDVYYNLRGVRVQKPHKGLYINNGKKTVVK